MTSTGEGSREQIAPRRRIENAYETLDRQLMAISGRMILWGSFNDSDQLARRYLEADGQLFLSLARSRDPSVTIDKFELNAKAFASEAMEYKKWARDRGGQPIYHEALIAYCVAFENFLKSVAVVLKISAEKGLDSLVYLSSIELDAVFKEIDEVWKNGKHSKEKIRIKRFYTDLIIEKIPSTSGYDFPSFNEQTWENARNIFELRNSIVHNFSRLYFDKGVLGIGEWRFQSGDIELNQDVLKYVVKCFREIAEPFRHPKY